MDLTKVTDKELQDELKRRAEEARQARLAERQQRLDLVLKHRDTLLELVPHSRTSCSDQDVSNGLYSAEYGPRCTRCGLLELDDLKDNFDVTVEVRITKVEE
jgi:hypothetical protein